MFHHFSMIPFLKPPRLHALRFAGHAAGGVHTAVRLAGPTEIPWEFQGFRHKKIGMSWDISDIMRCIS